MEGIILSSWDHIIGPQIEKLWLLKNMHSKEVYELPINTLRDFNVLKFNNKTEETLSNKFPHLNIYSTMCGQLLLGEVDSFKSYDEWPSRLYVSDSKILIAVLFHSKIWTGYLNPSIPNKDICVCFGTIFKRGSLNFAFNMHHVIDIHLRKGVNALQNSQATYDVVVKEIKSIVEELITLCTLEIPRNIMKQNPSFQTHLQTDLLCKAIVSHLQTSQCSLVIGASISDVNQVIQVLSLFSLPKESQFSILISDCVSQEHLTGSCIQGILKGSKTDFDYNLYKRLSETYFLSIVDVDSAKVWQAGFPHHSIRNTLSEVTETGILIPQIINEIEFLRQSNGNCEKYIENFYLNLLIRAFAFINVFESLWRSGAVSNIKEIMISFSLQSTTDLHILVGCAEKLKRGFRMNFM